MRKPIEFEWTGEKNDWNPMEAKNMSLNAPSFGKYPNISNPKVIMMK